MGGDNYRPCSPRILSRQNLNKLLNVNKVREKAHIEGEVYRVKKHHLLIQTHLVSTIFSLGHCTKYSKRLTERLVHLVQRLDNFHKVISHNLCHSECIYRLYKRFLEVDAPKNIAINNRNFF